MTFDKLRREGRDSVWAYVARNLSRPLAYSSGGGWAHVVVGNPPWVAYRHMSADLQKRFKELAKGEQVYVGGKFATQNDLCALFTVRAATLYLRSGGRIAFVLPLAALTRGQFERLRSGSFHSVADRLGRGLDDERRRAAAVSGAVLRRVRPPPRDVEAVARQGAGLFGNLAVARRAGGRSPTQRLKVRRERAGAWKWRISRAARHIASRSGKARRWCRACCVWSSARQMGRLGDRPDRALRRQPPQQSGKAAVEGFARHRESRSRRNFCARFCSARAFLPYRVFRPFEGVVPVTAKGEMLDAEAAANRGYDGLHGWMRKAEAVWTGNAESRRNDARRSWNYHNELGAQFPLAPLRVVYAASGSHSGGCSVCRNSYAVVEHKLYWAPTGERKGGAFSCRDPQQRDTRATRRGLSVARPVGRAPFRQGDVQPADPAFRRRRQNPPAISPMPPPRPKKSSPPVALPEGVKFQRARGKIRAALTDAGLAQKIDALVARLLDGG